MKRIKLSGKYAVGIHEYTIVDDEDYYRLVKYKWKAKWSSNKIYAVRNTKLNGKNKTLRMHRYIMKLKSNNKMDVDHINHDTLDNRKDNLRIVSRKENLKNMREITVWVQCKNCNKYVERIIKVNNKRKILYCVDKCATQYSYKHRPKPISKRYFKICLNCGESFKNKMRWAKFCKNECRYEYRRKSRFFLEDGR